ncbi:MAG TPA: class I SAM-dependent methyltransferase [Acidobacteriaceae bacterium]|nr:class I SAM-dependent methyltransferase [Acidobacteriaceae bacterium]
MQRQRWFEIHDQPWFPAYFRDLVTEALEAIWNQNHTYRPIAVRLREAVGRSGAERIVDLCSGSGGPWAGLYDDVAAGTRIALCLTDFYPNARLRRAAAGTSFTLCPESVDARHVPPELRGFRTIFSSFHHFDPDAARAILADAFEDREGIAVFESARREGWTMLAVTAVPFLGFRAALQARPFRWDRFFWNCLVPVVPVMLWIDGLLSCLRSYSLDDLRELTADLSAPDYEWQIGDQTGGRVPIRYLIGRAIADAGSERSQSASRARPL